MKHPESLIQRAFVQWCRLNEKLYPSLKLAYAVPNGGKRSIITASILKAEGARPGVPDWHLPCANEYATGLWIEFKAGKGKASPAQAEYIELLRKYGHQVEICNDAEKAIEIVKAYLGR